ncbi:hypothetical protein NWO25_18425 [Enterococcus lactis]|nr:MULTISPECIES: hypothetical protein [Enterococcus]MCS5465460.1 hypothetical protein [Enterococcus lactis]MDT2282874.1 hypothetical protein [Enterococcus faecium]
MEELVVCETDSLLLLTVALDSLFVLLSVVASREVVFSITVE